MTAMSTQSSQNFNLSKINFIVSFKILNINKPAVINFVISLNSQTTIISLWKPL